MMTKYLYLSFKVRKFHMDESKGLGAVIIFIGGRGGVGWGANLAPTPLPLTQGYLNKLGFVHQLQWSFQLFLAILFDKLTLQLSKLYNSGSGDLQAIIITQLYSTDGTISIQGQKNYI